LILHITALEVSPTNACSKSLAIFRSYAETETAADSERRSCPLLATHKTPARVIGIIVEIEMRPNHARAPRANIILSKGL
jgi:hypothetical protein